MSMIETKTPDEIKDYTLDWTKDIGSDTIVTSTWTVSPTGVAVTESSVAGTLATAWLGGGAISQVYQIKNLIVTSGGRDLTKSFRLLVVGNNYL